MKLKQRFDQVYSSTAFAKIHYFKISLSYDNPLEILW